MDAKQSVDVFGQAVGALAKAKQNLFSAQEVMVLDQATQVLKKVVDTGVVSVDVEGEQGSEPAGN